MKPRKSEHFSEFDGQFRNFKLCALSGNLEIWKFPTFRLFVGGEGNQKSEISRFSDFPGFWVTPSPPPAKSQKLLVCRFPTFRVSGKTSQFVSFFFTELWFAGTKSRQIQQDLIKRPVLLGEALKLLKEAEAEAVSEMQEALEEPVAPNSPNVTERRVFHVGGAFCAPPGSSREDHIRSVLHATLNIQGAAKTLLVVVSSATDCNVISVDDLRELFPGKFSPSGKLKRGATQPDTALLTQVYNGNDIPHLGTCFLTVNSTVRAEFFIAKNVYPIIGKDLGATLGLFNFRSAIHLFLRSAKTQHALLLAVPWRFVCVFWFWFCSRENLIKRMYHLNKSERKT